MSSPIFGVIAAQRAKKKLPRGKTSMTITPGWEEEAEPPLPPVDKRQTRQLTEGQKKRVRLQRA